MREIERNMRFLFVTIVMCIEHTVNINEVVSNEIKDCQILILGCLTMRVHRWQVRQDRKITIGQ